MRNTLLLLFVLSFTTILPTSCGREKSRADFIRMERLDSLLPEKPGAVLDSLRMINPDFLTKYNRAYYHLLEITAKDKSYVDFSSDSLAKETAGTFRKSRNKSPGLYSRSLLYLGIVRYRMGVIDITAYIPLKEALDFLESNKEDNPAIQYFCSFYLGMIHDKNDNPGESIDYFKEAIFFAEKTKDMRYLFTAKRDLFWAYMKAGEYEQAGESLDAIERMPDLSELEVQDVKYAKAVHYNALGKNEESLKMNLSLYQDSRLRKLRASPGMLYRISKNYSSLHQLDSALEYALGTVEHISDTADVLNYLYYYNAAEISEKLGHWRQSAEAFKTGAALRERAVEKELDTKIFELEKSYDKSKAENNALRYRNQNILLGLLSIIFFMLLVFGLFARRQHMKHTSTKQLLEKREYQVLSQEKDRIEKKLIEKEFMLPLYKQISQRNAKITSLLTDLSTNTYIVRNPELQQLISNACGDLIQSALINSEMFITDDKFMKFTNIDKRYNSQFNDSEKMLLVFMSLELDNKQAAVLFNTSESSIRGRKSKLRRKLDGLNIDLAGISAADRQ